MVSFLISSLFTKAYNALLLLQGDVGDLTSILTLEKITLPGLLTAVAVYMGWKNYKADQKYDALLQEYHADLKQHKEDFQKEAERFLNAMQQVKDLYNDRRTQENSL